MSNNDLELCLYECVKKNREIVLDLNDLFNHVENYQRTCNLVKTGGTTAGILGTGAMLGSIFLAPVTGGLSLALGIGGGALSISGGVTNIFTDVYDKSASKRIISNIDQLVKFREDATLALQKQIDQINAIVKDFVSKGVNEEMAVEITLQGN
jgi:hypothetical protein